MNDFTEKNAKLSFEFDMYLAKHPELFEHIPNRAYIVVTIENDLAFNEASIDLVRKIKRHELVEAHKTHQKWSVRPLELQKA